MMCCVVLLGLWVGRLVAAVPVKPGTHGLAIVHNLHAFSGTDEPVLQFECDDVHQRDAWVAALQAFTDKSN